LCDTMFYRVIPILFTILIAHTISAERFQGKRLRIDTHVGTELSAVNDNQADLPLLEAGETFEIELFLDESRANRTRDITIAFNNTNNQFGEFFDIVKIEGILPQHNQTGPTTISICANFPVVIPVNEYLATVTLSVKRAVLPGLVLGLDAARTYVMDEKSWARDHLDVSQAVIFFGRPDYDLRLDLNTATGNQNLVEFSGIKSDTEIAVQIFGESIRFMNGFIFRFEYDATQLEFTAFDPGNVLPNVQILAPIQTQLDSPFADVEVTAASFGRTAQSENGLLGTLKFTPTELFTTTGIRMTSAEVRRSGEFRPFFAPLVVNLASLNADFDNDGFVDFRDFILFAERFGTQKGDTLYESQFDLTPDGVINLADFLLFTESLTLFTITVLD
ncbi:MAG: hypothetical protein QGG64_05020, partial [Candidatus Latescibacteria bacterium]|nr:hypothetical protein [Candidatus Latescibacterota bacterium]